jgi:putative heme-binding domain-containing protein
VNRLLVLLLLLSPTLLLVRAEAHKAPAGRGPTLVPASTSAGMLRVLTDFKAELLYSVPADKQGSWVSMCVDPKGRLIVSDQYGALFRVTPPPIGKTEDIKVEKIDVPVGEAQGLLWAFDSLYVVVNKSPRKGARFASGLYRVTASAGDDRLDKVELLRSISGDGEHGPHAVMLTPDKKSLVVVCGNATRMMQPLAGSRVPRVWGEDHLLERLPDGNGFMRGVMGPGGTVYQVSPDGKKWELLSVGFRNHYDAAFNRHGELFTFDADMEWDFNTPWYRPTRVCHVTSGSEFGWRNGAGKWPPSYPDSLPAVLNVGPGSPTGVTFGYGARFPAKYQEAFFICDWSYGKLYAVHLTPHLSTYKADIEEFVTGTPLALTDIVVNPHDGALYFAVGGRKTQSALYRVHYVGKESTAPARPDDTTGAKERALRRSLEAFHGKKAAGAVEAAWPHLDHEDRFIRFAARVALEHQEPRNWQDRALEEKAPGKALAALLALVRVSATCPFHRTKTTPPVDEDLKKRLFAALERLEWAKLDDGQRLDLLRTYEVAMNRMGPPADQAKKRLTARLDAVYPSRNRELNADLCQVLVYLEAPAVVTKTLKMLAEAPTQEEQLEYARSLRCLKTGWTLPQRQEYFRWYLKAAHFKGGSSIRGFLRLMKKDAVATLTAKEKEQLKPILDAKPTEPVPIVGKPRPFVKAYKLAELIPVVEKGLKSRRDFDRGRRMFAEAKCFVCHRFDGEGGSQGPDLTGVSGRFGLKDLLESIVEPSKVISDQYAAVEITTTRGQRIVGRIVNMHSDTLHINTDMMDPNALTNVNRKRIASRVTSKVSMMPNGLIDMFKEDEIVDLVAYLLSRGDRKNKMFQ